jgi:hypothetical protein
MVDREKEKLPLKDGATGDQNKIGDDEDRPCK